MNIKYLIGVLLLISTLAKVYSQIPQATSIDSIFADWDKPETPGASLGVIKDGKLIYAKGYGLANMEYDIPNSPTSVFRIGSTSKQFTAACIVLLSQQNKLSLDATLDNFFPDFPDYAKSITVRRLLNHTSGIRDYLALAYLSGLGDDDFYTDETLLKWLVNQEDLNFKPGEAFIYSNSGYWLLGQIVNKVSGKNMADYAQEQIFQPLGMNDTHFHNDHTTIVKNRASGYYPKEEGYQISMTTLDMIGDGGIFSTIEDLKKWDDAYYKSTVLNREFWTLMTTQGKLNNGETIDYAAGLFIDEHNGLKTIDHGGAFVGFRADMIRFPEQRFSVIVLANRGDANPSRMGYAVADLFLKEQYKQEKSNAQGESDTNTAFAKAKAKEIVLPAKKLKLLEGSYWNSEDKISRKLVVTNDTITYDRGDGRVTKMTPISNTAFLWIGPDIPIVLTVNNAQNPSSFTLNIPGDPISNYNKYDPIIKLSEKELNQYAGDYYSKELDATYSFVRKNDGLIIEVNGEPSGDITPIKEGIFTAGGYLTIEFNKDKTEFRLAAGRVKNLKFVKK
jgi:CubicO group peptidase (beta-lactamase class C family)